MFYTSYSYSVTKNLRIYKCIFFKSDVDVTKNNNLRFLYSKLKMLFVGISTFKVIIIFYTYNDFSNVIFFAKMNLIYCLALMITSKINTLITIISSDIQNY